jgi:hypothetical protein
LVESGRRALRFFQECQASFTVIFEVRNKCEGVMDTYCMEQHHFGYLIIDHDGPSVAYTMFCKGGLESRLLVEGIWLS